MRLSAGSGGTYVKRLSQPLEFRRDITLYGKSNLYPQLVNEIRFRSPITNAAVNALASFTTGDGFSENGDLVINRNDQSLNDILKIVSSDYSSNDGWALHFNVNELGSITEITPVDFDFVRFGLPNEKGIHHDVKLNSNWENDPNKTLKKGEQIATFPLWQRREELELDPDDVEEFNGFILYWTPVPDQYPKSTFDAVIDSAQTNSEVQIYELGNMQNGFQGGSFYMHRGKIESENERQNLLWTLKSMKGAGNANSLGLAEVPIDFQGPLIEQIPANNQDRLFELTNTNSSDRIIANFGMPKAILGIQPATGMFNQEDIENAFVYYNLRTEDRRTSLEDAFNKFLVNWHLGSVSIGEILPSKFVKVEKEQSTGAQQTTTVE